MKLTDKQRQHLLALQGGERSAYPGLHMGVLNSLAMKGLVRADGNRPGAFLMPHTVVKWRLTKAGLSAINLENKS